MWSNNGGWINLVWFLVIVIVIFILLRFLLRVV
jgi:hypothetical protein